jgi:hypothetical protein
MSGHVEFAVDKVALGQVFPSSSVSPANSHSTGCSTLINRAGTIGELVADVTSGFSLTASQEIKRKIKMLKTLQSQKQNNRM